MCQELGKEGARLRDRIDTALQNAPAGKSPKLAFIEMWQDVEKDYETMRKDLHQYLADLLDKASVRATVASRTKTLDSISKSIDRRDGAKSKEHQYRSPRGIFDDLHDLVGFRIVVDYPSGLKESFRIIEKSFLVERFNSFSSDRAIGQHWNPKFGAYETRNYLLRSESSSHGTIYAGVLFEIQVTTMAESLYNKLAHPLLYKGSQHPLSRRDEMIIDMGHGAALLYWITVACMEEKLESNHEGVQHGSRFPKSVSHLAGHEGTVMNLDALVNDTPDIPSTSQDVTSIDFLLKSLADIRLSNIGEENIWKDIRDKLGFGQHELLKSLPTVPEARFDSKDLEDSPKCHAKTRHEVRNIIKQWVDDSKAETLFWLHGPAGVGKSTLARTLVEDLRVLQLAAGYFFKRGHELRNDTSRVFPTIASQLIRTIPSFAHALRVSTGNLNILSMDKVSLREQFDTLIYNPLRSIKHMPRNMVIIIDALDECTKPKNIQLMVNLFARLKDLETFRIRVFFSSRYTRALINGFQPSKDNMACREMALHEQFQAATRLEMKTVLEDGLDKIRRQRNVGQDPWPSVEDFSTILHYATCPSPLFIYTSTFLRHINGRDPNKRLRKWLERSRHSASQLDHIYDPILASILAGDADDGIREPLDKNEIFNLQLILGSLVLMARPLSANVLRCLLAISKDIFNMTLDSLHAVVHVANGDSPVNLIHKSFADYVLEKEAGAASIFKINPSQIHDQLTRRCIELMRQRLRKNVCNADSPLMEPHKLDPAMVAKFIAPDLTYACNHWVYHLERSKEAFDLVRPFLEKHLLNWLEVLSILGERSLAEGGFATRTLLALKEVPYPTNSDLWNVA
ncbi:uncharacterized protein B0J16DRAFT_379402 [Fusarium flagelliforme]|uniref:uncharacterized protein n=1 Tax=Fusarium flagelliforme TaxID=2675880 RepID=UPI001E8DD1C5|nr:uncharacterized protein B0J16DRAFT_379402 [Fusarium flagelliforme]KAH7198954.1 hypothetical protein B0J16DRAFT_379402 [Fusarium flagelliforme]